MATRTLLDDETTVQRQPMPLYHTLVHNCACHTFDDVILGLMRILGSPMVEARRKAQEIDFFGRAVVATSNKEAAELYAERLHTEVVSDHGTLLGTSIEPAS